MNENIKTDNAGRYTDCHFLSESKKKITCTALREFYHAEDPFGQCTDCPFYKTTNEFKKGWRNRSEDAFRYVLTEVV